MRHGNLFVISGPSGAGKGTLVARILSRIPDAWVSVSATTRKPRPGDVEGSTYLFVDDATFDSMIEHDELLEWAEVFGKGDRYGTPAGPVLEHMRRGGQVILEIDVQGAFQVRERLPEAHLVFIEPPDLVELEQRLRTRATESEDGIAARMETARVELSHKMEYDYRLVNDDLDEATDRLVDYIERCATDDSEETR